MSLFFDTEVLTVSQATQSIRSLLEDSFRFIHICGEISNLRIPYSGHQYFILKDSSAQIRAVLFKPQERYLSRSLKDGQQIICHGRISVYEQRGEYQLIVDIVEHLGSGELQVKFEQLKKKLAAEGLFDGARKKTLPLFPEKIVVVTSPSGAAIHDFLTVWHSRRSSVDIQILPVRVQGKGAGEEIAAALDLVNRKIPADMIVLCRGGGSIEDLWAFNEECVARAIDRSKIPVVTGIGHEIDFTIADFCADLRAPTPTGAAEKIVPDNLLLRQQIASHRRQLLQAISRKLTREQKALNQHLRFLGDLQDTLQPLSLRLDLSIHRFTQIVHHSLLHKEQKLGRLLERLERQTPLHTLALKTMQVEYLKKRLIQQVQGNLQNKRAALAKCAALLDSMSPLATLGRGYAIVRKADKGTATWSIISHSSEVHRGDQVEILLGEGSLNCEVLSTK
ncbi:MAG: exodeoxyribonuclease VII large subunit [Desulfoprunum sp.]|nr:exodeoxyribonuclease VII large subunit [Desulfoprunum sp.]